MVEALTFENLVVALLVLTGWVSAFLATHRVWKAKSLQGVSLTSTSMALGLYALWVSYGLAGDYVAQIIANAPPAICMATVLYFARKQDLRRVLLLGALPLGLVGLSAMGAELLSPVITSIVLTITTVVNRLPQLIAVLRGFDFSGLSLGSSVSAWLSAAGWSTYGFSEAQLTVALCSLWSVVVWSVIALRIWRFKRPAAIQPVVETAPAVAA